MNIVEAEQFAQYVVFEKVNNEIHDICICQDFKTARCIAYMLAQLDADNDAYHVTNIDRPGNFVPGGGWCTTYQKEDGIVKEYTLD